MSLEQFQKWLRENGFDPNDEITLGEWDGATEAALVGLTVRVDLVRRYFEMEDQLKRWERSAPPKEMI